MLTRKEQELLIKMLKEPITFKNQKIYRNRISFYKGIWKLRDMGLVMNRTKKIGGRKVKEWSLKTDGIFLAKLLLKGRLWGSS